MKKKIIKILVVVLIVLGGLFSWWYFNKDEIKVAKEEKKKIEITEKYEEISQNVANQENIVLEYQKQFNNTDIVGELYIPNTDLKTPVAHYSNNEYYLNHLLDKSYSTLGSVFLDYRNNIDDRKILIYGHNSQDIYTEFRFLENYLNYNYYLEHSDMYLRTVDNNYHYKIFSVYVAINDFRHVNLKFDDEGYAQHLQWLKDKSAYNTGIEVNKYDNVLVIQTCYFNPEGSYLIIAAKRVDE